MQFVAKSRNLGGSLAFTMNALANYKGGAKVAISGRKKQKHQKTLDSI